MYSYEIYLKFTKIIQIMYLLYLYTNVYKYKCILFSHTLLFTLKKKEKKIDKWEWKENGSSKQLLILFSLQKISSVKLMIAPLFCRLSVFSDGIYTQ